MTNKEYADSLRELANIIEIEKVKLPFEGTLCDFNIYCHNKQDLVDALQAFGAGETKQTPRELILNVRVGKFTVTIRGIKADIYKTNNKVTVPEVRIGDVVFPAGEEEIIVTS